jgi:hypothetical protein
MNSVVSGSTTEQTLPNILAAMRKSSVVVASSHGALNEILTSHFIEGGITKSVTGTTSGIGIIENHISTMEPVKPDLMARSNLADTPRYLNLFFAYSCKTVETDTPLTMNLPIGAEVDSRPDAAYAGFSKVVYTGVANDFLPPLASQITNWSYLSEHFKQVARNLASGQTLGQALSDANGKYIPYTVTNPSAPFAQQLTALNPMLIVGDPNTTIRGVYLAGATEDPAFQTPHVAMWYWIPLNSRP